MLDGVLAVKVGDGMTLEMKSVLNALKSKIEEIELLRIRNRQLETIVEVQEKEILRLLEIRTEIANADKD